MALRSRAPATSDVAPSSGGPVREPAVTPDFGFNSFSPAMEPLGPVYTEPSFLDGLMTGPMMLPELAQDSAGAPAPVPVQVPVPIDPQQTRSRATTLYRAMDGWGTDEDSVMSTLRGLKPAEIAAIRADFQDHYGLDLDAMIADEMGGEDLTEAEALLAANPVDSVIAGLENSIDTFGDDEAKVEELMRGLSPTDREALVADPRWASIRGTVRDALGGSDLEVFDALEQGNAASASAIRLDDAMGSSSSWFNPTSWGTDEEAVYEQLAKLPATERARVEAEFDSRMTAQGEQTTLRAELGDELSGADQDRAVAVLEGNIIDEQVARLSQTMDGLGTSESELYRLLEQPNLSDDQRDQISARFQELNGRSLESAVASETSGTDLERAQGAIAGNGKQDPAFMLFFGMEGAGTDEQLLRDTLAGKTAAEIQQIRETWNSTYAQRYGSNFDAAFQGELTGRDNFDIVEIALRGRPETDAERAEILELQYSYERGDRSTAFGRGYMDAMDTIGFSSSASQMDRQHERLQAQYDENGQLSGPEGSLTNLYAWGQDDLQDYRAAKDSATEALATGAEIGVAALATVLTDGAASPWLVAALAGVSGGAAGIGTRMAIQGEAYGEEAIAADTLKTVLSAGVSAGMASTTVIARLREVSHVFGSEVGNDIAEYAVRGAVGGTANGAIAGAMNGDALREGAAEYLLSIGQSAGMGGLSGALTGAVSKGAESALEIDQTTLGGTILNGAITNSAGAAAGTAIEAGTYSGSPEDIALRFLRSAGTAAIEGTVDGAVDYRTRSKSVSHAVLFDGRDLEHMEEFRNLSDSQRSEVLQTLLDSGVGVPTDVIEKLGFRSEDAPVRTEQTESTVPEDGNFTAADTQELATLLRQTGEVQVSDPVNVDGPDDLQAYREELVLQELVRMESRGESEFVESVLDQSTDIDAMEAMLMRANGGSVSGGGSVLGELDISTPHGAVQLLTTAGIPNSQLDTLDGAQLDALARYAQAYSSGDLDAASRLYGDLSGTVDANVLQLMDGALVASHYGLQGAQDVGLGSQARIAQVLHDDFEASPDELTSFREYLGDDYQQYLGELQLKLPEDHEIWSSMSEEEAVAVYGYTTSDYATLNPALRGLDPSALDELLPYIAAAESGLQKLPSLADLGDSNTTTIRGVGALPPEIDAQLQPGENFTDRAFFSTSRDALNNFQGDYEFLVEGSSGRPVDYLSKYEHEREVLYPTGTTFEVLERTVDPDTGRTTIRLKENN